MTTTILEVLGIALVVVGVSIVFIPAGLVVAGVSLLWISRSVTRGSEMDK